MVMQRVVGIALGYEDLNDHDELRHDPVLAVLAEQAGGAAIGLRAAGRQINAEPAGTEPRRTDALSQDEPRPGGDRERCLSTCSWRPTRRRRRRSSSTWIPPTIRCTATRKAASSTATMIATATCRSTSSAAVICWRPSCAARTSMPRPARWRKSPASWRRSAAAGQGRAFCCAAIPASPANP